MEVKQISKSEAKPWVLKKHYLQRMPPVQYAFGLFHDMRINGVVTYGTPPKQIMENCFRSIDWCSIVELNRLCVDSEKENASSILVSRSLKMLPSPCCVVSYADSSMGHIGYIYQACNFHYSGAVTAHDSVYVIDGVRYHSRTLTGQGITNPTEWARENGIERIEPEPKHRYFYFVGNRKEKKLMRKDLNYPVYSSYPKGEPNRYDIGEKVNTISIREL